MGVNVSEPGNRLDQKRRLSATAQNPNILLVAEALRLWSTLRTGGTVRTKSEGFRLPLRIKILGPKAKAFGYE